MFATTMLLIGMFLAVIGTFIFKDASGTSAYVSFIIIIVGFIIGVVGFTKAMDEHRESKAQDIDYAEQLDIAIKHEIMNTYDTDDYILLDDVSISNIDDNDVVTLQYKAVVNNKVIYVFVRKVEGEPTVMLAE